MQFDLATFQGLIAALQHYWSEQGCIVQQPYDMEVGAGTFHTSTFIRAIGPEPWNACHVQGSRRPTDGRYGENPNRLQHYFQFQVVMKPSPDDFQELYLGSLKALGFDPLVHDIRFVEDNWESPTLGAWGLGWEVWLNGMEVTQFTYFQQVGGLECRPVMGEIAYGLERLAMYIQGVDSVYDLVWAKHPDGAIVTAMSICKTKKNNPPITSNMPMSKRCCRLLITVRKKRSDCRPWNYRYLRMSRYCVRRKLLTCSMPDVPSP